MDIERYLHDVEAAHDEFQGGNIDATGEALQYAYQNDLIIDHRRNSFSLTHLFGNLIRTTFPRTGEDAFTDYTHLAKLEVPDILIRENISLTNPAFILTCEACQAPRDEEVDVLARRLLESTSTRRHRMELPILRSDNDWDLRKFKSEQLARLHVTIKGHGLPPDTPDKDSGEGMELAANIRSESELFFQNLQREKLGVTRDGLKFLADQLKFDITVDDLMNYLIGEVKYDKNPALQKITPPVSPKLGRTHFVPSANSCLVPIPSNGSSSFSASFEAIEDALLADYQDQWSEITTPVRELLETEYPIEDGACFQQGSNIRLDDLKVEIPLMISSAPKKPIIHCEDVLKASSFTEVAKCRIVELPRLAKLPDNFLGEKFQKIADETARSVEQEQLQQVDAVARVPIPVMNSLVCEPGWNQLHKDEHGILKWIQTGREGLFKSPHWPIHKAGESKLIWKPLGAGMSLVPEEENMDDSEGLVEILIESTHKLEPRTSADFVHAASNFVVLQNHEEDEEIETQLVKSEPRKDLMDIVRKRSYDGNGGIIQKRPRLVADGRVSDQPVLSDSLSLLPGSSPGTSGKLLANFMGIHAPKKKTTQSRYFASREQEPIEAPCAERTGTSSKSAGDSEAQHSGGTRISHPSSRTKAPYPEITSASTPLTVFISIAIPRRLIRALEALVPDLTMIERDYEAYNMSVWRAGSVARNVIVPAVADDADITVSPSTGVIITNMIRVRQKPRTGTTKGMIQTRIEKASLRYSQLVVLVGGEGGADDVLLQISTSDSAALTELQGFVTGLDCHVRVYYVGGCDSTLEKWLAFCLCKYGTPDHGIQTNLLKVETLWEIFLRRTGLNVYAAQAVASQLKPTGLDGTTAQDGLGAFVTMTRAERLGRFGQLVGPKVLERVSATVDEVWIRG